MTTPYRVRRFIVELLAMVVLAAWYAGLALFWPGVRDFERDDERARDDVPPPHTWPRINCRPARGRAVA